MLYSKTYNDLKIVPKVVPNVKKSDTTDSANPSPKKEVSTNGSKPEDSSSSTEESWVNVCYPGGMEPTGEFSQVKQSTLKKNQGSWVRFPLLVIYVVLASNHIWGSCSAYWLSRSVIQTFQFTLFLESYTAFMSSTWWNKKLSLHGENSLRICTTCDVFAPGRMRLRSCEFLY